MILKIHIGKIINFSIIVIGKKSFRFIALPLWLLRKKKNLDGNLAIPNDMEKVVAIQSGLRRFDMKLQKS